MPHFFSDSSAAFLVRYQFIPRSRYDTLMGRGGIPTDALSLMDVMLHTNSIFTVFYWLQEIEGLNGSDDTSAAEGSVRGSKEEEMAEEVASDPMKPVVVDMLDFDAGLSEELLAPLLLSFLDFYLDQSTDMMTVRRALRAFFETTPYLCDLDDTENAKPQPLHSNIAILLLNLTKALLKCESMGWMLPKLCVRDGESCPSKPMLPWLCSRAEHATRAQTWYWWTAQHPRTMCNLLAMVSVSRRSNSSRRDNADEDAITISHPVAPLSRKRWRVVDEHLDSHMGGYVGSRGIAPLPYEVQELVLEYLSPRALSAALIVCRMWRILVRRSPTMCFYRYAGRIITRVFLRFLREDWGQTWIRVDHLTTLRRLSLHHKHLSLVEHRLQPLRQQQQQQHGTSSVSQGGFAARLHGEFGPNSCEWALLDGLWNAVELELKLFPCVAPQEMSLITLFHDVAAEATTNHATTSAACSSSYSGWCLSQWAAFVQLRQLFRWMERDFCRVFSLLLELVMRRCQCFSSRQTCFRLCHREALARLFFHS